jgi:hypothetical protein
MEEELTTLHTAIIEAEWLCELLINLSIVKKIDTGYPNEL